MESVSPRSDLLVEAKEFLFAEPFTLENGDVLPEVALRYETYGELNANKSNAILVCHALTGDHHCAGRYHAADEKPGWWDSIIGPGKPIDTDRFFVIGSNVLGGCSGSTGPTSVNPETGKVYGIDFPDYTIQDMVSAQKLLTDHLGIQTLYAVIGGSMGGMQALQWGVQYPAQVQLILPLATTACENAQTIAFNEVGRNAIIRDAKWNEGRYAIGVGPDIGLAIARMMAHITYLSDVGLDKKFGRERVGVASKVQPFDAEFEVESYLRYQGQKFVQRFDANTYLYLTKAIDRFNLYDDWKSLQSTALARVEARVLVIGFSSDWLYPPEQNRDIVRTLLRYGKEASYLEIGMDYGHDSFLMDAPELFDWIGTFLRSGQL